MYDIKYCLVCDEQFYNTSQGKNKLYCSIPCATRAKINKRNNRPLNHIKIKKTCKQKFEEKIDKNGPVVYSWLSRCWIWIGLVLNSGYGQFWFENKKWQAHRMSYEIYIGPIPGKFLVCHKCDNRQCINPDHLFLGDHRDNALDSVRKGRAAACNQEGENNPNVKNNRQIIEEIRKKYIPRKYSLDKIAKEYDLAPQTVHDIVRRKIWKNE